MNVLLAMIPAFFWGSTYAIAQFSLPEWPALLLGALRALPAGLILLLLRPTWPNKRQWGKLLLLGTVNIGAFFCLIFIMAQTLPSAISGVGMVSLPVFAMLFQYVVFKHTPTWPQMVSGGAIIFFAWQLFNPQSLSLNPLGLLAMCGAISCIVIGSQFTQQLGKNMPWWQVLTWQLILGGGIISLISAGHYAVSPMSYHAAFTQFSLTNGFGLAWIIVLNTALGYGLYVWLLQRMSIVTFTFGGIANPIAGILFGVWLVGEQYQFEQYLLMLAMITCSLLPSIYQVWKSRG